MSYEEDQEEYTRSIERENMVLFKENELLKARLAEIGRLNSLLQEELGASFTH